MNIKVSNPTIGRLFRYHRAILESRKVDFISSEELSGLTGCSAAQIRKDLTYFGEFGTPGKGYRVDKLTHELKDILGINRHWDVALIGVGNLGRALVTYSGLELQGFNINMLFDSDPNKIGKSCSGMQINDINKFAAVLSENDKKIKIAIIAVPAAPAQEVVNILVAAGIKAILNFAPTTITVPSDVKVLNIDMANELSRLSYYLMRPQSSMLEENSLNSDALQIIKGGN